MLINEFYQSISGDYQNVLERLGDSETVKTFIIRFPNDPSYSVLRKALTEHDIKTAFLAAHTLKGICLNLGLGRLEKSAVIITETLRGGAEPSEEMIEQLDADYRLVTEAVKRLESDT